jgi:hypothetical protein
MDEKKGWQHKWSMSNLLSIAVNYAVQRGKGEKGMVKVGGQKDESLVRWMEKDESGLGINQM